MNNRAQIPPGTLDSVIPEAASLKPQHGYGILLRIGQISNGDRERFEERTADELLPTCTRSADLRF